LKHGAGHSWYDGNGKSKQLRRSGIIPSGFCVFGPLPERG
jgi:hypothetical protein